MNRTTYTTVRRSIRDNGIRYTYQHAIDTDNTDAMFTCEDLADVLKGTDWLAYRQQWMQHPDTTKANIIRLTSTLKETK